MANANRNYGSLILLVLAGEAVFFLPFVIPRIFRPSILSVYEISNTELGTYFSAYGIVAMISYIIGGPLADKFQPKNLLSLGLVLTALGGFALIIFPSIYGIGLYAYWGCSTILVFWAALIKSTRLWGGAHLQGKAFGFLEGGRGLLAALMGTLGVAVFANQMETTDNTDSFQMVLLVTSSVTFLAGVVVFFGLPKMEKSLENQSTIDWSQLLKNKKLWLQSIIVVCAYVGYKITDDFSLFASDVLSFDEVQSSWVGTGAIWLRPVFAITAGLMADRFSGGKIITAAFLISIVGGILLSLGISSIGVILPLVNLVVIAAGIYGLRGVYFAIMDSAKIGVATTGTAVGIISIVGYTPDVFMSPLMGYLLDNFEGELGHRLVFAVLSGFSFIGMIAAWRFSKTN